MPRFLNDMRLAAIGCWMIVTGNAAGQTYFDMSIDGFWRSFRWAFVLAVCDTLDAVIGHSTALVGDDAALPVNYVLLIAVNIIASLLTFFAFPIVVALLAKYMGLSQRYAPYIIVRNWLTVFLSFAVYILELLSYADIFGDDVRLILVLALYAATLYTGTMNARMLLQTPYSLSFGFALMDFLMAILIGAAAMQLVG